MMGGLIMKEKMTAGEKGYFRDQTITVIETIINILSFMGKTTQLYCCNP